MVKKIHLALLFIAALTFGQNNEFDFTAAEDNARKLIFTQPSKALPAIKRILSQDDLHDTIKGKAYNLYGIYYGVRGKPDSTIYYQKKSIAYLKNYPALKVKSLMNLAIGYRNKGEYATSVKHLEAAIKIQKKLKNNKGLATAYGEIASNYTYMANFEKSVDYLLKAIPLLKDDKYKNDLIIIKQKLAGTYLSQENYPFAIDLYRECLTYFKETNSDHNYYLTQINLGYALGLSKKYNDAEKALEAAASGLAIFGDRELTGITAFRQAQIKQDRGLHKQADIYYESSIKNLAATSSPRLVGFAGAYIDFLNSQKKFEKALTIIDIVTTANKLDSANSEDQLLYQNAIASTYKATKNEKEAIKAYQSAITIMDSIAAEKRRIDLQEIQAKFQTDIQREKNVALEANNAALQKEMETEKVLLALYGFISLFVIVLILLFLRGYWLRNRLQDEELKAIEVEKEIIQQQHAHEQELTNAQREIIEEKQRELTSTALRMANYQDSIAELIEKCANRTDLKVTDIKKDLQLLMKQKDYWKQFETRFNNLHPEFGTNLTNRFAKLTKNDIEFCSLLKLNLSNKEIAALLQISHESAITKKYRIKKKMEISDDAEFERILHEM